MPKSIGQPKVDIRGSETSTEKKDPPKASRVDLKKPIGGMSLQRINSVVKKDDFNSDLELSSSLDSFVKNSKDFKKDAKKDSSDDNEDEKYSDEFSDSAEDEKEGTKKEEVKTIKGGPLSLTKK